MGWTAMNISDLIYLCGALCIYVVTTLSPASVGTFWIIKTYVSDNNIDIEKAEQAFKQTHSVFQYLSVVAGLKNYHAASFEGWLERDILLDIISFSSILFICNIGTCLWLSSLLNSDTVFEPAAFCALPFFTYLFFGYNIAKFLWIASEN
jgi:hypothetical protein